MLSTSRALAAVAVSLLLAGCSADPSAPPGGGTGPTTGAATGPTTQPATVAPGSPAAATTNKPAGRGTAEFTAAGRTWVFTEVICSGDPRTGFELRGRGGDLRLSIGVSPDVGHVEVTSADGTTNYTTAGDPQLAFTGKQVAGKETFLDYGAGASGARVVGSVSATCP